MFVRCFRGLFGFSTERSKGDVKSANGEHLKSEREREEYKTASVSRLPKMSIIPFFCIEAEVSTTNYLAQIACP